jgi:hypothetical protein
MLPADIPNAQLKPKETYAGSVEWFLESRMFVSALLTYRDRLGGRQRQVLDIFLNDAVPMRVAGERLGIGTRTACTYLHRAYVSVSRMMQADIEANGGNHALLEQFREHLRDLRMNTSTSLFPRARDVRSSESESNW